MCFLTLLCNVLPYPKNPFSSSPPSLIAVSNVLLSRDSFPPPKSAQPTSPESSNVSLPNKKYNLPLYSAIGKIPAPII